MHFLEYPLAIVQPKAVRKLKITGHIKVWIAIAIHIPKSCLMTGVTGSLDRASFKIQKPLIRIRDHTEATLSVIDVQLIREVSLHDANFHGPALEGVQKMAFGNSLKIF